MRSQRRASRRWLDALYEKKCDALAGVIADDELALVEPLEVDHLFGLGQGITVVLGLDLELDCVRLPAGPPRRTTAA